MDIDKLWSRKIRVHGHGKTVESSWPLCGHVLWTFLDVAGKLPGCCAEATPDAARTATSIAKSSANHLANIGANLGADIYRRLVRCFPPTARTHLGSCPDDSADTARTPRRMLRGLRRQLRSHLPTVVPTLVRTLARTFTGAW